MFYSSFWMFCGTIPSSYQDYITVLFAGLPELPDQSSLATTKVALIRSSQGMNLITPKPPQRGLENPARIQVFSCGVAPSYEAIGEESAPQ